jgi:integrase
MTTRNISDRWLQSRAEPGLYWDDRNPGFGVRVSDTRRKTFLLNIRYPKNPNNPTRRALGHFGPMSLAEAREKARVWMALVEQGKDPEDEQERAKAAQQRKRKNTFASVVDDFIAEKLSKERKGAEVAREIKTNFLEPWGGRPITDIHKEDIALLIKAKARTAPAQARNMLATLKRFFTWAEAQHAYGIEHHPAAPLKPMALCGEKTERNRALSDDELIALWRAAKRMRYPYGPIYRLLLLTGLRLNEVVDATWDEFDLKKGIWTVPPERMKAKNSRARPHAVPITPDIRAIIESLPRFKSGDHLFSTTHGRVPVWVGDKIKTKVDARMLRTLRAMAKKRGDNPRKVKLESWRNHDLRRNVRSGLSQLRIAPEVAEAVLAHVRPGIQKVYDTHTYLDEKREALQEWAGRLRDIVEPPPSNVVKLGKARA